MEGGGMKKLCIFLIKVEPPYYLLLGILIGLIVFSKVGHAQKMIPTADMNPLIFWLIVFLVVSILPITQLMFYSDKELRYEDIGRGYFARWDNYFPIKINTELSLFKRVCGYIYAISWVVIRIAGGYTTSAIACLLLNK